MQKKNSEAVFVKKKLIYGIFIIFICCYCFLSCTIARTREEESLYLYGEMCKEAEEGTDEGSVLRVGCAPVKKIYNNLSAEEYIERQNGFVPVVMIENSSKGYKILLETGQSYKMKTGDCLFLGNREEMEIVELSLEGERGKVEQERIEPGEKGKKENDIFIKYDGRKEIFLCRSGRNKLYISYF